MKASKQWERFPDESFKFKKSTQNDNNRGTGRSCSWAILYPRCYFIILYFSKFVTLCLEMFSWSWKDELDLSHESGEEDQAHLLDRAPTQLALCLRLATDLKGESWLCPATLDDSKTPTPVLHNTSVVLWNLYCVRVIIIRLNKRSKPRSFVHN